MKTFLVAMVASAALCLTASTAPAQTTDHALKWHGPGIFKGGDDDRTRVRGRRSYYVSPYYGGFRYGYPLYTAPYWYGGGPLYATPYGGYRTYGSYQSYNPGFSFPTGHTFPTYRYQSPGFYWAY